MRPLFTYLRAVTVPTGGLRGDRGLGRGGRGRPGRSPPASTAPANELAALAGGREPEAEADPYASVTPFEQLLHGH